ncbi:MULTISPECIES: hypothetical protein [unclassified Acinetobacter]|uniref:hypothetical protein n=1 Tax=unclassified Acinetobacter TaxID=196816 RepID=UPI0015D2A8C3|nr:MULTISPECIES: hypothetical protein [unclassified Acinetobacter]
MHQTQFQDPKHKLIALYYGGFSILAVLMIFYFIGFLNLFSINNIIYLLFLLQLIITISGSYLYWKQNIKGLITLKWISFSLIFLICTPYFLYIPNIALIFGFYIEATPDSFFYLPKAHIGYNTSIKFNTAGTLPWGFGLNFIELIMFLRFRKILKETLQQT